MHVDMAMQLQRVQATDARRGAEWCGKAVCLGMSGPKVQTLVSFAAWFELRIQKGQVMLSSWSSFSTYS